MAPAASGAPTRVVVITGASGGIGEALARAAHARGAAVVLAARRAARLTEVAGSLGARTLAVATDVTRRAEVERLAAAAISHFGAVDVWVNNAGRGITRAVLQLSDDDFDEMMRVNVKSALYGMQAILPHFMERGRGQVINVSSMLGRVPFAPQRSAYNAAKHALNALTASLRMDLVEKHPGIRITTVSPPVVATEFGVNALGGGIDSRQFRDAQPVEEVAAVIVEAMEHPSADVYTRPGMREAVAGYFAAADMAAAEAALSATFRTAAARR